MTSTVLDMTVLLLCVSASVVALGAVGNDPAAAGPRATEVADLVATETVTVTYASDEAPNGTRTIHATRAELVALVATERGGESEERAPRGTFESEALAAVKRGIGPRTRIDAEGGAGASDGAASESESGDLSTASVSSASIAVGSEPPRSADVTVAVIAHPAPNGSGETETVRIVIRRW
ncbi:hypothetical protein DJ69_03225 [Halorubrum persicum]|uniref:Uncharacterized protein n=1 Tax=Halorubrum persicum TaxID=1383844 RepID=A0A2G1WM25_9EURY|nr:hypothetical protein [Halorubrum persicum]PHQ39995.1 hypothetical protein DJ69_03225 [Halorubrum persicum]